MNYNLLILLDYFFLGFHSLLIIFNISGWIWKKTRKLHFVSLLTTMISWFIVGIWYGWGYCFVTDWHWQIREQMGHPIVNDSYTGFLIKEISGYNISATNLDNSIMAMFFIAFVLTVFYNISDYRIRRIKRKNKS